MASSSFETDSEDSGTSALSSPRANLSAVAHSPAVTSPPLQPSSPLSPVGRGATTSRIHVAVRPRPLDPGVPNAWILEPEQQGIALRQQFLPHSQPQNGKQSPQQTAIRQQQLYTDHAFAFDSVFSEASTTDEVYATCISGIVEAAFAGINGAILTYGGNLNLQSLMHSASNSALQCGMPEMSDALKGCIISYGHKFELWHRDQHMMRFGRMAKILAKCMLKYYRISECSRHLCPWGQAVIGCCRSRRGRSGCLMSA